MPYERVETLVRALLETEWNPTFAGAPIDSGHRPMICKTNKCLKP
jgi:hypothetical protein